MAGKVDFSCGSRLSGCGVCVRSSESVFSGFACSRHNGGGCLWSAVRGGNRRSVYSSKGSGHSPVDGNDRDGSFCTGSVAPIPGNTGDGNATAGAAMASTGGKNTVCHHPAICSQLLATVAPSMCGPCQSMGVDGANSSGRESGGNCVGC